MKNLSTCLCHDNLSLIGHRRHFSAKSYQVIGKITLNLLGHMIFKKSSLIQWHLFCHFSKSILLSTPKQLKVHFLENLKIISSAYQSPSFESTNAKIDNLPFSSGLIKSIPENTDKKVISSTSLNSLN